MIDIETLRTDVASFERRSEAGGRRAAVALAVVPADEGFGLVLEERPSTISSHAGQYSLPGGRRDHGETSRSCALRETQEELGIHPDTWEVLGELDDYVTARGTVVTPVVLLARRAVQLRASPAEVRAAYILRIGAPPPALLWTPAKDQPFSIPGAWPAQRIALDGFELFAPTAAIVHQFLQLAHERETVRVAEIREPAFADGRPVAADSIR